MVTYHSDVKYLEHCDPALIERNAAEFVRMHRLLQSVEPSVTDANNIEWESEHRPSYDARLKDVKELVETLGDGFQKASAALFGYADKVAEAKDHLKVGISAEKTLRKILGPVPLPIGEPMRTWEALAEVLPIMALIEDGNRAYEQADEAFSRAKSIEEDARDDCLAKLRTAHNALPDFRGGDFKNAKKMIEDISELRTEAAQAKSDANAHLPGFGTKIDKWPDKTDPAVSAGLNRIRMLTESIPHSKYSSDGELEWIKKNKKLLAAVGKETGLPPDLIAGILLKEKGEPNWLSRTKEELADFAPWAADRFAGEGNPDKVSYGPMEIQIRTAADVLGYDPNSLSDEQRDAIRDAISDPVQSLFIAAEYLEHLKAETDFADVPADELTDAEYQNLVTEYNGDPKYGEEFMGSLEEARRALR